MVRSRGRFLLALLVRRITLVGPLSLLLPIRSTAFMATITKSLLHLTC
jgi:hypothetical protein